MGISQDSKRVLQAELDQLRLDKQGLGKLLDELKVQSDDLKSQIAALQSSIDKIKADIDAL